MFRAKAFYSSFSLPLGGTGVDTRASREGHWLVVVCIQNQALGGVTRDSPSLQVFVHLLLSLFEGCFLSWCLTFSACSYEHLVSPLPPAMSSGQQPSALLAYCQATATSFPIAHLPSKRCLWGTLNSLIFLFIYDGKLSKIHKSKQRKDKMKP